MATDEGHGRDAMAIMRQVLMEMVEYMPDSGGNEHKARWERALNEAHRHIDAIRVRGDSKRKEAADVLPG